MGYMAGNIVYFQEEDKYIFIVMSSSAGVRYFDPENIEFNDDGCVKTGYLSHSEVSEKGMLMGEIEDLIPSLMRNRSK